LRRALSPSEKVAWLAEVSQPPICAVFARLLGPVTREHVARALSTLRRLYPQTALRLDGEGTDLFFETEDVPAYTLREFATTNEDWLSLLAGELVDDFDSRVGPPFRFALFHLSDREKVVAFYFPHLVADGLTSLRLLRDWVSLINQPDRDVTPVPLAPPLEELLPEDAEEAVMAMLAAQEEGSGAEDEPERCADAATVRDGSTRLHMDVFSLDRDQTGALIERARAERASVLSCLGVAFAKALDQLSPQPDGIKTLQFPIAQAPYLKQEVLGCFFTMAKQNISLDDRPFWEIARAVKAATRQLASRGRALTDPVMFARAAASTEDPKALAQAIVAAIEGEGVDYDFSLSSLTNFPMPDTTEPFQLQGIFGSYTASPGERYLCSMAQGGRLWFTMVFRECTMTPAFAAEWRNRTLALLAEALAI
jgi:hypothetical protein